MSEETGPPALESCRALLVPDSVFWVTGTICRQIAIQNSWLEATIVSTRALRRLLRRDPELLSRVDLVHFLDPWAPKILLEQVHGRLPCIGSVHHLSPGVVEINRNLDLVAAGARKWVEFLVEEAGFAPDDVALLPYGVDTSRFVPATAEARARARRDLGIGPEAFVVGFFSKRSSDAGDRKGIDVLIEGLRASSRRLPRIEALIVGPGWGDLVTELRAEGLRCHWTSFLPDQDSLVAAYHALDAYWITSRVEGGPLTLLEAMSCGISCVSTPVGIAPEVVVDGENSFLVPTDDVEELVQQTKRLAEDTALRRRIGAQARVDVSRSRDWSRCTANLGRVYAQAIRRFEQRHGASRERPVAKEPPTPAPDADGDNFPLNAVTSSLRPWVRMLEILYWVSREDFAGDTRTARRLIWRACRLDPWSRAPWAALLRIGFPRLHRTLRPLLGWGD